MIVTSETLWIILWESALVEKKTEYISLGQGIFENKVFYNSITYMCICQLHLSDGVLIERNMLKVFA